MSFPCPHPRDRPVRILFVFASLAGGPEEDDLRLLARGLDRTLYRIDALPCARAGRGRAGSPVLAAMGVEVDETALDLGFDATVSYLAKKITGYEIIVSCQDVADIYPAMDRLKHHPPPDRTRAKCGASDGRAEAPDHPLCRGQ